MHVHVTPPEEAKNKGSSRDLVYYLEKENYLDQEKTLLKAPGDREYFFSHQEDQVQPEKVIAHLDMNKKKLSKTDDKFFLVNISPSQKELAHIGNDPEKLKAYTKAVMEEYASNFNKGLESKDLVWYAKLERERHYKHTDREVQLGERKVGEKKPGDNMHVQVIVSRKCAENKIKLSANNHSRTENKNRPIKGNTGFDRVQLSLNSIKQFDEMYQYPRQVNELEKHQVMKHGSPEEKQAYLAKQVEKTQVNKQARLRKQPRKARGMKKL